MTNSCSNETLQRTDEWFEKRKRRITASIVGGIMGVAPYMSRDDAMNILLGKSTFKGNSATDWGTFNEETARAQFELETGLKVENAPFVEYEDWLGASPDGYVSDGALLEIKCPYLMRNGDGEFKSIDDMPHYYYQMLTQMFCCGITKCYFYQWSPFGTKLEVVEFDTLKWIELEIELKKFYEKFLLLEANPIDETLVKEYFNIKETIKKLEERSKEIMSALVAITDEEGATFSDGHKLYKVEKDGAISYAKALKELLPDADLEPYRGNKSEYWVLK